MNHLKLTKEKLSVSEVTEKISSPNCGALSLFIGTTRDFCANKKVLKLEYESYDEMAIKVMKEICTEIRNKWPEVKNIAILHRLGTVPVMESSVIIGISSVHRIDAMRASEWCIDQLKARVPIWKKEIYANNEQAEWKENVECPWSSNSIDANIKAKSNMDLSVNKKEQINDDLVQIKASNEEIKQRIQRFMERKKNALNITNILDFCVPSNEKKDPEFSCARVDAVLVRRKDSKSHLKVRRVMNLQGPQTVSQTEPLDNNSYLNPIEERLKNVEKHLLLTKPVSPDIYQRLKQIEDRILELESLSPEYCQFWKNLPNTKSILGNKRKISVSELEDRIQTLQQKVTCKVER